MWNRALRARNASNTRVERVENASRTRAEIRRTHIHRTLGESKHGLLGLVETQTMGMYVNLKPRCK